LAQDNWLLPQLWLRVEVEVKKIYNHFHVKNELFTPCEVMSAPRLARVTAT
jgi:hypothetical protein